MNEFKKVLVIEDEIQAQVLEIALKEREIPHILRSYHDSAFDGLFQGARNWGHIEAPEEYHSEIKELYEQIKNTQG